MKYKITEYNEALMMHGLKDERGNRHMVDLFVSGNHSGFGQTKSLTSGKWLEKMKSFIGRTVEISELWPHTELARDAVLLKEDTK